MVFSPLRSESNKFIYFNRQGDYMDRTSLTTSIEISSRETMNKQSKLIKN